MARALSLALHLLPENLRGQALKAILVGLSSSSRERIGPVDRRVPTLTLSNEARSIGGLVAETFMGWLSLDGLWVVDAHRGHGHATTLLVAAEDEARRRRATDWVLETFSFKRRVSIASAAIVHSAGSIDFRQAITAYS